LGPEARRYLPASLLPVLLLLSLAAPSSASPGWAQKAPTPVAGGYGEAAVGAGNYVCVVRCYSTTSAVQFWRYDPSSDSWSSLSVAGLASGAFRNGTALAWDGGGIPKIQKIEPELLELPGGYEKSVTVTVKNEEFGDTFYIEWSKPLPSPIYCASADTPAVEPDQTVQMKIWLGAGRVEEDRTVELPFAVKAMRSGRYDNGVLKVKLIKGFGPAEEYSSVTVFVLDKKTESPIEGAVVICATAMGVTDKYGKAYFENVHTGTQTVYAEKEGYYRGSTTVSVSTSGTSIACIYLKPVTEREPVTERKISLLLIAAIVSAIAVGSGAAYYFYKRKRP
jgi:hypothetical protein